MRAQEVDVAAGTEAEAEPDAEADAGTSAGSETFVAIVEKFCNRQCLINFMHMHAEQHWSGRRRDGGNRWGGEGTEKQRIHLIICELGPPHK